MSTLNRPENGQLKSKGLVNREPPVVTNANSKKKAAKDLKVHEGIGIPRYFTTAGRDPFSEVAWELRTAQITGESGKVYFEQKDVEIPKSWSTTATNVVVQ